MCTKLKQSFQYFQNSNFILIQEPQFWSLNISDHYNWQNFHFNWILKCEILDFDHILGPELLISWKFITSKLLKYQFLLISKCVKNGILNFEYPKFGILSNWPFLGIEKGLFRFGSLYFTNIPVSAWTKFASLFNHIITEIQRMAKSKKDHHPKYRPSKILFEYSRHFLALFGKILSLLSLVISQLVVYKVIFGIQFATLSVIFLW